MSNPPSAFPLAWPAGRPRTPPAQRKAGNFNRKERTASGWMQTKDLTIAQAADRVEDEVSRLGGAYLLISSNVEVTLSGRPRSGMRAPDDPGVCVYFQLKGKPYALACDTYRYVEQNLAAIAAHIEATRAITRHGVATAEETLRAFEALPAPKRPYEILGIDPHSTTTMIKDAHRRLISEAHPDKGGSVERAAELNAARDAMLKSQPA